MVTKDGKTLMPFGLMGGHYQATGHAAFLSGIIDHGLGLKEAMDVPCSFGFGRVLEGGSDSRKDGMALVM